MSAAVAMQRRMLSINDELKAEGYPEIGIGIGLHTGEAIVGYIGSERRSEYTAIRDTVNTASRLESNAQGGQNLLERDGRQGVAHPISTDSSRSHQRQESRAAGPSLRS